MNEALLVIDTQKIYTNPDSELYCEESDKALDNINLLISSFANKNKLIIMVRHIHKADGSDLGRMFDFAGPTEEFDFVEGTTEVEFSEGVEIHSNSHEIHKTRYSSFVGTKLMNLLNENQIKKVVICGFMTNFCCESTSRDAHDRDLYVDFIIDATGCPDLEHSNQDEIKHHVKEIMESGFAVVLTTKEYLEGQ
ncbi:MAG: cysteine hydrolase [Candidatus Peribacteraceae bacterium]|nr:cysteine hydrolase [Candidatus Peribacteraceae bacterium]